jgi:hypothetical protein
MDSQRVIPPKDTCNFQKANGEWCKRTVASGETKCWQHAKGWKHRFKALTRNQAILFAMTVLALLIGIPAAWLTYDSWRIARQRGPASTSPQVHIAGPANTQGDLSPSNTGDGNTFIYGGAARQKKK